jgi:hypothetical protein
MGLLFERFLSESRAEWPDIDLDLPSEDKREQAMQNLAEEPDSSGPPQPRRTERHVQPASIKSVILDHPSSSRKIIN